MIIKKVLDDSFYFLSADEFLMRLVSMLVLGIFIGWIYTLTYVHQQKRKAIKEEYKKTLDDRSFRQYLELESKLK